MKITFLLPAMAVRPVGGYRVIFSYADGLSNLGHRVCVVFPRYLASPVSDFLKRGKRPLGLLKAAWRRLSRRPGNPWQPLQDSVEKIFVSRPAEDSLPDADIIFATWWPTAAHVAGLSPAKGAKFYLVQDFFPHLGSRKELVESWRLPLRKIAVSSWLAELMKAEAIPETEISVIPNGIALDVFRLLQPIEHRSPGVAMMFAPGTYKAPKDGLAALEIVRAERPDARFVCYGAIPPSRPLPDWVEFHQGLGDADLARLLNACSIFMSSSLVEGFALPPAEAMACGCAVAATDSGGIREYARHGVNALLSPPGEAGSLASNILRYLKDEDLRTRIAGAGSRDIQEFRWARSIRLMEERLSRALAAGPVPSDSGSYGRS